MNMGVDIRTLKLCENLQKIEKMDAFDAQIRIQNFTTLGIQKEFVHLG